PRPGMDSWDAFGVQINNKASTHLMLTNLNDSNTPNIGDSFQIGDFVTATMVGGWPERHADGLPVGEAKNVVSIVIRLEYDGKSVLFGGDTIGRHIEDPDDVCKFAELDMVNNSANVPLQSDVMIAGHHGAANASARCFIDAIAPTYVIFSAGNRFGHPRKSTVQRFLDAGVPVVNIYRTDRGNDETNKHGHKEWKWGAIKDCKDGRRDDDILITLPEDGPVSVEYKGPDGACQ
ncbi:MAG: hypothetical protein V3R64_03750, partial [Sphingomonadales bacterium]